MLFWRRKKGDLIWNHLMTTWLVPLKYVHDWSAKLSQVSPNPVFTVIQRLMPLGTCLPLLLFQNHMTRPPQAHLPYNFFTLSQFWQSVKNSWTYNVREIRIKRYVLGLLLSVNEKQQNDKQKTNKQSIWAMGNQVLLELLVCCLLLISESIFTCTDWVLPIVGKERKQFINLAKNWKNTYGSVSAGRGK